MDWLAMFVTTYSIWAYGRWPGKMHGPLVGILGSVLWLTWSVTIGEWAIVGMNVLMFSINAYNAEKAFDWTKNWATVDLGDWRKW